MDFFRAQDQARRNTQWLVLLFLLAVAGIIVAIYLVASMVSGPPGGHEGTPGAVRLHWDPELFAMVALGTLVLISGGSLFKVLQLTRGGGAVVAESLGGRAITRGTDDLLERRLLNVVDEMAIASGVTVPQVYVLDDEPGINAFAAGTEPNAAVVAVTRGCLEQLSRDELQGVVAHEFSHILNGDMRLNLRLLGILHGILLIALIGRIMLRASSSRRSSRSKNSGGIVLIGLALLVVGYVGVFFGKLIKAAVSRQREFLADAAAVQFTRNPLGIAGALQKIGGMDATLMQTARAEEASHMFFGQGVRSFFNLLATHPPIEERIARIDPAFRAQASLRAAEAGFVAHEGAMGFAGTTRVEPEQVRASVGNLDGRHLAYAHRLLEQLPELIRADLHDPNLAGSVVYAVLVAHEADAEARLVLVLGDGASPTTARAVGHLPWLREAGQAFWLPLVELGLPALRELPEEERRSLLANVDDLVRADGRLSLFEFALIAVLRHGLEARRGGGRPSSGDLHAIRQSISQLLSLLAHAGHGDAQKAQAAFDEAAARAPLDGEWTLLARSELTTGSLEQALDYLAGLKYGFKGRLIEACVAAIASDGQVSVTEAELLRAIGARLDCPVPPLMAGPAPATA